MIGTAYEFATRVAVHGLTYATSTISNAPLSTTCKPSSKKFTITKVMLLKSMSFLFILQHHKTLEYCYFYASNNEQLLKSPRLIRNKQDFQKLLNHLAAKDFPSLLKEQRPNTKWVIECIVNPCLHPVMTTYSLGNPPHLPDYIKNNRYIVALEKDTNNAYRYKDHLCFFRCLDIGKFGKNLSQL